MTIHIEGRRWFQRTYGNTYHSVRIFEDGEQIAYLPQQYGYDDQYIQTAIEWLEANNKIEPRDRRTPGGTLFLRETLKASYSVSDVSREKDL